MTEILNRLYLWINESVLGIIQRSHNLFWNGNEMFFTAFIAGLIVLLNLKGDKAKGKHLFAVFTIIALFAICYNPMIYGLLLKMPLSDNTVFARVWIIIPVWMVIAYAGAEMYDSSNTSLVKNILCLCLAGGIVFAGSSLEAFGYFTDSTFPYKANAEGVEIAETVLKLSSDEPVGIILFRNEQEQVGNFYNGGTAYYAITQYSGKIGVTPVYYNEQVWFEYYLSDTLPDGETSTVDYINDSLIQLRQLYDFSYVVMPQGDSLKEKMSNCGYQYIASVSNNDIYVAKTRWYLKSFSDLMGNGKKLYVLSDNEGHFIVIGGGNKSERRQLQQILDYCGYHVDIWILPSTSAGYIEGLNCLLETDGYTIDRIVLPTINIENAPEGFMDERDMNAYDGLLSNSEAGQFELCYVSEGDEFDVYGLVFQVLSDMSDIQSGTALENSMLFRVVGGDKSFLFCSYISFEQGQEALVKYGDLLDSDYVQISSGTGTGLGQTFYDAVSPDIAFCDSVRDDAGRETYDYLVSVGVTCYSIEGGDQLEVVLE